MKYQTPAVLGRKFIYSVLALAAIAPSAGAENYPAKPVRFVTAFAPGGNADILARILSEGLSRATGQRFIVENRPGGSSIVGTQFVANAAPDGYTILMVSSSHSVNPTLFGNKLPYDTQKDFVGITKVGATPMVLVAHPGLGVNSLKDLIAKAKIAPGTINYASSGNGSPADLAGELLNAKAGIRTTHIPYKSTQQGVGDTMAGQVQLSYASLPAVSAMIKSGMLRPLGITSSTRSPVAPDIPALAESLPGYEASIWTGVVAPAGVPKPILAKLNAEIVKVLNHPETKAKLEKMGVDVDTSTPQEFDAFIASEIKKWAGVVRKS